MTGQADHPDRTLVRGQNVNPPDPVPGAVDVDLAEHEPLIREVLTEVEQLGYEPGLDHEDDLLP